MNSHLKELRLRLKGDDISLALVDMIEHNINSLYGQLAALHEVHCNLPSISGEPPTLTPVRENPVRMKDLKKGDHFILFSREYRVSKITETEIRYDAFHIDEKFSGSGANTEGRNSNRIIDLA